MKTNFANWVLPTVYTKWWLSRSTCAGASLQLSGSASLAGVALLTNVALPTRRGLRVAFYASRRTRRNVRVFTRSVRDFTRSLRGFTRSLHAYYGDVKQTCGNRGILFSLSFGMCGANNQSRQPALFFHCFSLKTTKLSSKRTSKQPFN
jgi:hypothetical protein